MCQQRRSGRPENRVTKAKKRFWLCANNWRSCNVCHKWKQQQKGRNYLFMAVAVNNKMETTDLTSQQVSSMWWTCAAPSHDDDTEYWFPFVIRCTCVCLCLLAPSVTILIYVKRHNMCLFHPSNATDRCIQQIHRASSEFWAGRTANYKRWCEISILSHFFLRRLCTRTWSQKFDFKRVNAAGSVNGYLTSDLSGSVDISYFRLSIVYQWHLQSFTTL